MIQSTINKERIKTPTLSAEEMIKIFQTTGDMYVNGQIKVSDIIKQRIKHDKELADMYINEYETARVAYIEEAYNTYLDYARKEASNSSRRS